MDTEQEEAISTILAVTVRHAAIGDLDVLVRFNAAIAQETEGRRLDPERLRQGTRAVLESSARGYYLVAERDAVVVGQLFVTYEWSDWRNGMFWWIQSVYVSPARSSLRRAFASPPPAGVARQAGAPQRITMAAARVRIRDAAAQIVVFMGARVAMQTVCLA